MMNAASRQTISASCSDSTVRKGRNVKVYDCISKVSAALSRDGIEKGRTNTQQNFKFRGIDDVINALSPLLVENGVIIIPRVVNREVAERVSGAGKALFSVSVIVEYDWIAVEDGSKVTATVAAEAMDSGDKATSKAMSMAYKYMVFQVTCPPTEGVDDADQYSHTVLPSEPKTPAQQPKKPAPAVRAGNPYGIPGDAWLLLDATKNYDELLAVCGDLKERSRGEGWNKNLNECFRDKKAFFDDIARAGLEVSDEPHN